MGRKITTRLIVAIVSTSLEEAALAAGVLWGLPRLDIHIPLWVLIIVMLGWATYTIITYRMGSRALMKKPIVSLLAMVGSKGKVVSALTPGGFIRIKGELWKAISVGGRVDIGEEVTVVGQERFKLSVRRSSDQGSDGTK